MRDGKKHVTDEVGTACNSVVTYIPISENLLPKVGLNFPGIGIASPEILAEERLLRPRVHAVGDDRGLPGSLPSPGEGPSRPQGRRYDTCKMDTHSS